MIALCGAGGTGKGTLMKELSKYGYKGIPSPMQLTGHLIAPDSKDYRDMQMSQRAVMQYSSVIAEINAETVAKTMLPGEKLIVERSVLDFLPYMKDLLRSMQYYDASWLYNYEHYKAMVYSYLQKESPYKMIAYLPIEFEPQDKETSSWKERDGADRQKTQQKLEEILKDVSSRFEIPVITLTGTVKERAEKLLQLV